MYAVIIPERRRRLAAVVRANAKRKLKLQHKEIINMEELAKKFVGKTCVIYTITDTSATLTGTIKEVSASGMLVECKNGLQAVNLEYVTRIRECKAKN